MRLLDNDGGGPRPCAVVAIAPVPTIVEYARRTNRSVVMGTAAVRLGRVLMQQRRRTGGQARAVPV
jgi:hypothetical protein